jgi:hypothetical protein
MSPAYWDPPTVSMFPPARKDTTIFGVRALARRSIEHIGSARFHGVLIACSTQEVELRRIVQDALAAAMKGGPPPIGTRLAATPSNIKGFQLGGVSHKAAGTCEAAWTQFCRTCDSDSAPC